MSLCEWKAPTITSKPVKKSGRPGKELRYDLTVKNKSTLCGKQKVELTTTKKPSGWTVTISKQKKKTFELLPGESKKYIVRIVSSKKAGYKKYTVNVKGRFVDTLTYNKTVTLKPVLTRK